MSYDWPGNVRELQNVLHRYLAVKRLDFMSSNSPNQPVELNDLTVKEFEPEKIALRVAVENLEKAFISKALDETHWNGSKTATLLGISRRVLFRKTEILG